MFVTFYDSPFLVVHITLFPDRFSSSNRVFEIPVIIHVVLTGVRRLLSR